MLISKPSLFRLATGFAVVGLLTFTGLAAPPDGKGGGKGGGGDEEPPQALPNVVYDVRIVPAPEGTSPVIHDMNEELVVVGYLNDGVSGANDVGFMYSYDDDTLLEFYDMLSTEDLQEVIDGGWTASRLTGINDWGLAVGYLKNDNSPRDFRGFMLDTRTVPATVYYPDTFVPGFIDIQDTIVCKVNNWGDALGHFGSPGSEGSSPVVFNAGIQHLDFQTPAYDVRVFDSGYSNYYHFAPNRLTDSRFILLAGDGGTVRYDILTDSSIDVPQSLAPNIAESGALYGEDSSTSTDVVVELIDGSWEIVWQQDLSGGIVGINSDGDVVTREFGKKRGSTTEDVYIYSQDFGKVNIDDLIDPSQADFWQGLGSLWVNTVTERFTDSGFSAMAMDNGRILVPYLFERN